MTIIVRLSVTVSVSRQLKARNCRPRCIAAHKDSQQQQFRDIKYYSKEVLDYTFIDFDYGATLTVSQKQRHPLCNRNSQDHHSEQHSTVNVSPHSGMR